MTDEQNLQKEYDELELILQKPQTISDKTKLKQFSGRFAILQKVLANYKELSKINTEIAETTELMKNSPELAEVCQTELEKLANLKNQIEQDTNSLLNPKPLDTEDKKNIIIEIRAGVGGDEASLFAAELFSMYSQFALKNNFKTHIINSSKTSLGGFKEIIFEISGDQAYSKFQFESGVHRIQRVPDTEKSGRIHTSTVSVAVLPVALETELIINPSDLKIEATTAGGHGGQSVNTTYSAIRIVHIPTGVEVQCQDERNFQQNKERAMKVLRTRLLDLKTAKEKDQRDQDRKSQIGNADRSEKIRTYNVPQDRLTDHRIKKNFYNLEKILKGDLENIVEALLSGLATK